MIKFDSVEYWDSTTWDRYSELLKVNPVVFQTFIEQEQYTVSAVKAICNNRNESYVLDLACGTGRISESILKCTPNIHLTLADKNINTLEIARKHLSKYSNVSFEQLDAYTIGDQFPSRFHVIIIIDFLHHISDPRRLISQLSKALTTDGILIGNVFSRDTYYEWDQLKYGKIKSFCRTHGRRIAEALYPNVSEKLRLRIRSKGYARIAPLSLNELIACLSPFFKVKKIKNGYYYWFLAKKLSEADNP